MVIKHLKRLRREKKARLKGYSIRQVLCLDQEYEMHVERISDNFKTLYEISDAVKVAGLEHSNVIIGIDFSASNEWQGRNCFNHKSLHYIGKKHKNPYQRVISIIPDVLQPFDEDNLIPTFGFGCSKTKDKAVFSFNEDNSPCKGFLDVLEQYERIKNTVELSGPTSLVPIINKAIELTVEKGTYHILVIVMDGQVEQDQDKKTKDAIVNASLYPLSIIAVGVGDGPWDRMHDYDDRLPRRHFDNFQFVDYHECTRKACKSPQLNFALHALMEIPDQYKQIKRLGMLPNTNVLNSVLDKNDTSVCHKCEKHTVEEHNDLRRRNVSPNNKPLSPSIEITNTEETLVI